VDAVLTPEQRKLLNEYANAAAKAERGRQATPSPEELLAFNENLAATLLRRLMGAAAASGVSRQLNLGFGGLVAAQQTNVALDNIAKQGLDPARVLLTEALMGGTTTIRTAGGQTVTRPWLEVLLARPRPGDKVQAQLMEATLRGLTDSLVYNYRLDPGTVYATEEGAPQEEAARSPVAADPRSLRAATQ
jgi:hypothetical protein